MSIWSYPSRAIILAASLFLAANSVFAASDSAKDSLATQNSTVQKEDSSQAPLYKTHPIRLGLTYEFGYLSSSNLETNMSRKGKRFNADLDVAHMLGVTGQYSLNEWVSLFGVLGYREISIEYEPRDASAKKESMNSHTIQLQLGVEVGFSFLTAKNYQLRAIGFAGLMSGLNLIDDYYMSTPLYGYVRGIGLQLNLRHFAILGGVRSTHVYWHTYSSDNWENDDDEFMADFDLMSSPFISIGIGF